jgi:hypothetical protein
MTEIPVMNKQMIIGASVVAIACGLLVVVVASNWKGSVPDKPTVYPAHGKLVFKNGDPVRHTYLTFTPKETGKGFICEAFTGADGTFEIRSFSNTGNDGAVPGEYSCILEQKVPVKMRSGQNINPSTIPKKYQDAKTSGLTIVINAENNDLGTIKLD